jgi:phosphate transport system permease protein
MGTIAAVVLIFVFLAWVVLPLFGGAEVAESSRLAMERTEREPEPIHIQVDEYRSQVAVLLDDGRIRVLRFDDGGLLEELTPFPNGAPTAWSFDPEGGRAVFGFADGSVSEATLSFATSFPRPGELPPALDALGEGQLGVHDGGIVQRTPGGALRVQRFRLQLGDPVPSERAAAVELVDAVEFAEKTIIGAYTAGGHLDLRVAELEYDMFEDEEVLVVEEFELDLASAPLDARPLGLHLGGLGDVVYLTFDDGSLLRYDVRKPAQASYVEQVDLTPEDDALLTVTAPLLGRSTILSGDSQGRLRAWFTTKPEEAGTVDGATLVLGHDLPSGPAAVTALGPSPRSRMLAVGFADGTVQLQHVTTEQRLVTASTTDIGELVAAVVVPKEDGIVALGQRGLTVLDVDPGHPEATLAALFLPVWYEGYPAPEHSWQSSSGTDDFEAKLGLFPLIFGTLKATLYSMLFGAPLALLAAIFTSEFLDRRLRTPIKSTIEVMASLPSVVLGFLAALVIAPALQGYLPAILASFLTLPLSLLLGAYAWQMLPQRTAMRLRGWPQLACTALMLPLGVVLALGLGPWLESALFAGDVIRWLDGQVGQARGGWAILLLPVSALVVLFVGGRLTQPVFRRKMQSWSRATCARMDALRFLLGFVAVLGLAYATGWLLEGLGSDPRGSFVDTYVQRNSLIVGFVMGFAIIPIIYTLSEDALSSVPEHLRLASLGAGATTWQTATRVIVPTAMSGLFSAVMIGLGRAVGETMIVLMATGNTAVMEWNVFSGFRTLSANLAVELPEAVQGSTHYRTLFLAALVLFAMTFFLNTLAESVRQRFRKRAFEL